MDDTWVIQQQAHKHAFLDHINSIDPTIKFTVEGIQGNGAIPFLDTLVTPQADNSLSITMYHKPTYTDQYLQWDSHHSLSAKYSVIGTLTHRAKTVCTELQLLQRELQHLRKALVRCKYPHWAINRVHSKLLYSNQEDSSNNNLHHTNNNLSSGMEHQTQTEDINNQAHANSNPNASTGSTTILRFQGQHHNQASPHEIQGPGLKGQEKWSNLQLPVQSHSLQWGVHRGDSKDPWGKMQGAP